MTRPVPSAEAIEAVLIERNGSAREWPGNERAAIEDWLTAAYAIDAPAIYAAGVAEGRAQMRAELDRAIETRENANAVSSRLEADVPRIVAEAKRERTREIALWLHEEAMSVTVYDATTEAVQRCLSRASDAVAEKFGEAPDA